MNTSLLVPVLIVIVVLGIIGTASITILSSPSGSFTAISTAKVHYACVECACKRVDGAGENECTTSKENSEECCHSSCVPGGTECKKEPPGGTWECSSDAICSHLECKDNACVPFPGNDKEDQCKVDAECDLKHSECSDDFLYCNEVDGEGSDECQLGDDQSCWNCNGGPPISADICGDCSPHSVCNGVVADGSVACDNGYAGHCVSTSLCNQEDGYDGNCGAKCYCQPDDYEGSDIASLFEP